MELEEPRRSERINLQVPIEVAGTDFRGEAFVERTQTLVLSRHGAKILLQRKLVPDEEINIHCLTTGIDAEARLVGQTGGGVGGYHYGVEFLDKSVNLADIEFPPLSDSEDAAGRALLECGHCHNRELVYLSEFEVEVLHETSSLTRHCKRCSDTTIWKEARAQSPLTEVPREPELPVKAPPAPPVRVRSQNERKYPRLGLKIPCCIRHPEAGEEILITENVSRGGFRFKSHKRYALGWLIDAVLPYSRDAANIFAAAEIVYAEELSAERASAYGVSYLSEKQRPQR